MPTWDEADAAYTSDLINHYEIGKVVGFVDGALSAYNDIKKAINLQPEPTMVELNNLLDKTIASYEADLEEK
jgi:hypothetical protein